MTNDELYARMTPRMRDCLEVVAANSEPDVLGRRGLDATWIAHLTRPETRAWDSAHRYVTSPLKAPERRGLVSLYVPGWGYRIPGSAKWRITDAGLAWLAAHPRDGATS